jgi:hypothetical protein
MRRDSAAALSAICTMQISPFGSLRGIPIGAVRCFPAMFPALNLSVQT